MSAFLTGDYGGELEAIYCDVVDTDVVTTDDAGEQVMGRIGLGIKFKPDLVNNIPKDCPLTRQRELRDLGSFATCIQCSHSILDDGSTIEC